MMQGPVTCRQKMYRKRLKALRKASRKEGLA